MSSRAVLGVVVTITGCTHPAAPGVPWAAAGIDWSTPPAIADDPAFASPRVQELSLANGVRVLLVENHRLPIVTLATIHTAAGSRADGDHPGLAALTLDLLDDGAGPWAATQFAAALDREGARLDVDIASDYASVQLVALSDHLPACLDLLAAAITQPRFADADVLDARAARAAELELHRTRPRMIAAQLFDRIAFGAHPYARPAEGTAAGIATLTAADLRAFWQRAYTPATTIVVVAGDITRAALDRELARVLGRWTGPAAAELAAPPVPVTAPQLAYVDVPGAAQSIVLIGRAIPAAGGDTLAADVANTMLGGSQTARLDHELRDTLAATFGASASFWRGRWGGTWTISTATKTAATVDAIRAALRVVETTRTVDAPPDELARAATLVARAAGRSFDTTSSAVRALVRLVQQGLPLDHGATVAARAAAITPAVARAAIAPLWTEPTIVVVGDWAVIGDGLRALGLPVVRYDADGNVVPP
jgi:zinc protease